MLPLPSIRSQSSAELIPTSSRASSRSVVEFLKEDSEKFKKMKFLIFALAVTGALARPSVNHGPLLKFSNNGGSFSYSFQTPAAYSVQQAVPFQHAVVPLQRYVQHQVYVAPAVNYVHGASIGAYKQFVDPANIQVSSDGFVLDTAEVANARAEHLRLVAEQNARVGLSSQEEYKQEVQNSVDEDTVEVKAANVATPIEPANIQLSPDGKHVLETPEVAQARAEHLARFNEAAAIAAANPEQPEEAQYNDNSVGYKFIQPYQVLAAAPIAVLHPKSHKIANIQLSADGHVLDTPEVAQAKAEHFAKFAEESSRTVYNQQFRFVQPINVVEPAPLVAVKAFQPANIQVSADGHVLDTPEVAQAKSAHFAQYAADAARAAAAGGDQSDYSDSSSVQGDSVSVFAARSEIPSITKIEDAPADIKVSADGFVLDTPEVAQLKSEHLAKLAIAGETYDDGSSNDAVSVVATNPAFVTYSSPTVAHITPATYSAEYQQKWNGPEADIKVGADGYLVDTPEVQQARSEHLSTRSAVLANAQSSWSGAVSRYAQVLPTGQYIQDTPEVAAARTAHLAAYAKEASRVHTPTYNYGQLVYSAPFLRTAAPFGYAYSHPEYNYLSYRYAPAAPVALTPDGQFLLDTPEVAAAKADHFAAHAKALQHQ